MNITRNGLIAVFSLSLWSSATYSDTRTSGLSVASLSRKWNLEEYSYLFFTEAPGDQEANDYLFLKNDMSFTSVSEGLYEEGKWRLDVAKRRIHLSVKGDNEELVFIVHDLDGNELILVIDDPNDKEAGDLKIHFKS